MRARRRWGRAEFPWKTQTTTAPKRSSLKGVGGHGGFLRHARRLRRGVGRGRFDDHARAGFLLRSAEYLQVRPAASALSRMVAMARSGVLQSRLRWPSTARRSLPPAASKLGDDARRRLVGKMPVPAGDALLDRPRPLGVRREQGVVVVGFDEQRRRRPDALVDQLGRETQVGQEPESRRPVVKHEPDRIHGIVRHGKRLHGDILDLEVAARGEKPPVAVFAQRAAVAQGFRRERVAIDGQLVPLAAKHFQAAARGRRVRG